MNTNVSKHYGIFSVLWLVALVIFPFGSSWSRVHARESSNAAPATELVVSTIAHLNFMPLVFRAVPNVAPTDILLSLTTVAENMPINTWIGMFSTTDPNAGDTFTYSLVSGAGDSGNGSFNISGHILRSSVVFDYETQNSYSIRVRSTDQGGLFFEKVFTITITYVAQNPTDILLSNSTIQENLPVNTVVGTLSTTDPNAGDTFTYALVSGAGDTGNGSFNIAGNQLRSSAVFDYEMQNSYSIRIRTTDQGGLFFEKVFIITITPAVPDPILNGNFEQGPVIWQEYSTHGWPLILDSTVLLVPPYDGSWATWLGGDYNEVAYIQQQVTVQAGLAYFSYWHWIASEDICGYDVGGVLVNDTAVDAFWLCDDNDTNGWVKRVINLSAYTGQSVSIQIRAVCNGSWNSNLFIDHVAFQSTTEGENAVIEITLDHDPGISKAEYLAR